MKFFVLGGYGIIGKSVVNDLARFAGDSEIFIAGRDVKKAKDFASTIKKANIRVMHAEVNDIEKLAKIITGADVVVNCIQYEFNLNVMKACLKARTNYVDLGGMFHMTKKQLELNNEFMKIGKIGILGMGASPGMSNVMASYGSKFLKRINSLEILFADTDSTKYEQSFVLPYSFKTIIDEYTMKPAVLKNGKMAFVEPMSGAKKYHLGKEFGVQSGQLTLHSELATLPDFLKKEGLKNCEFRVTFDDEFSETINKLIELGFTSRDKVTLGEKDITTLDMTAGLMDRLIPKEKTKIIDKEMIRVIFDNGKIIVDMITNSDGKTSSGVLDTGIPCSIAAQMIANKMVKMTGTCAPESCINHEIIFKELRKRGIAVYRNGITVN